MADNPNPDPVSVPANAPGYGGIPVPRHTVTGDPALQPFTVGRNPIIAENGGASVYGTGRISFGIDRVYDPTIHAARGMERILPPSKSLTDNFWG